MNGVGADKHVTILAQIMLLRSAIGYEKNFNIVLEDTETNALI